MTTTTNLTSNLSQELAQKGVAVPENYENTENFFQLTLTTKDAAEKVQAWIKQHGDVVLAAEVRGNKDYAERVLPFLQVVRIARSVAGAKLHEMTSSAKDSEGGLTAEDIQGLVASAKSASHAVLHDANQKLHASEVEILATLAAELKEHNSVVPETYVGLNDFFKQVLVNKAAAEEVHEFFAKHVQRNLESPLQSKAEFEREIVPLLNVMHAARDVAKKKMKKGEYTSKATSMIYYGSKTEKYLSWGSLERIAKQADAATAALHKHRLAELLRNRQEGLLEIKGWVQATKDLAAGKATELEGRVQGLQEGLKLAEEDKLAQLRGQVVALESTVGALPEGKKQEVTGQIAGLKRIIYLFSEDRNEKIAGLIAAEEKKLEAAPKVKQAELEARIKGFEQALTVTPEFSAEIEKRIEGVRAQLEAAPKVGQAEMEQKLAKLHALLVETKESKLAKLFWQKEGIRNALDVFGQSGQEGVTAAFAALKERVGKDRTEARAAQVESDEWKSLDYLAAIGTAEAQVSHCKREIDSLIASIAAQQERLAFLQQQLPIHKWRVAALTTIVPGGNAAALVRPPILTSSSRRRGGHTTMHTTSAQPGKTKKKKK